MAQRAVFQSVASMGLPAFTIHSIVRYSGRALKDVKNTRIRSYGPIGVSDFGLNIRCPLAECLTLAGPGRCTIIALHVRSTGGDGSRMEFP